MAELSVINKKIKAVGGILKAKIVFEKLQKTLLQIRNYESSSSSVDATTSVPEGHFAVIAEDGGETKRFVVPLRCLSNPTFMRLLEEAAEEYGFDRDGALTIPCRPNQLEMLLAQQWQHEGSSQTAAGCHSSHKAMVKCCQGRHNVSLNLKRIVN